MKVLFVRPPRYMWPFNSESSAFWQPLGFASMAAVLRENDIEVEIIDCLPLKIGWKSLERILAQRRPDVVCVGEETCSSNEALRLASLVKSLDPRCKIVAGGHFFTFMTEFLGSYDIDFIIKGEGEHTLLELVKELSKKEPKLSKINGLSFVKERKVVNTRPRKLIKDLDDLPMPAYDLLPMGHYGRKSRNHPKLGAIEHSRGCSGNCNFCTIWKVMGNSSGRGYTPCYRTKSVDRTIEEVELLVKRYGRKTLGWVDSSWNMDAKWNEQFSEAMVDNNLEGTWSTIWTRSDAIVRDEKLGVMKKIADAGIVQCIIGGERIESNELADLNKRNNEVNFVKEAIAVLNKYPDIAVIDSYIVGLENEDKRSLRRLYEHIIWSDSHFSFLIPMTPHPGTELWEKNKERLMKGDFRKFNFHNPIMPSRNLSVRQLKKVYADFLLYFVARHPLRLGQFLLQKKPQRVNNVIKKMIKSHFRMLLWQVSGRDIQFGIKPKWYDS